MTQEIQINVPSETIFEKKLMEIARAMAADAKAVQDYNIMMGILEDPNEDEGEIE